MVIIFDSGIFMQVNSAVNEFEGKQVFTTPEIEEEILSRMSRATYTIFKETVNLSILKPSKYAIEVVRKCNNKISQGSLSNQDISIIALAIDMKLEENVILYSDDFGIRNLAKYMGIKVKGVKQTKKINIRKYIYICKACDSKSNVKPLDCPICGHEKFKRRYIKI